MYVHISVAARCWQVGVLVPVEISQDSSLSTLETRFVSVFSRSALVQDAESGYSQEEKRLVRFFLGICAPE